MTDSRHTYLLTWVDSYYPLVYQDDRTKAVKGSSVAFFKLVRLALGNAVDFQIAHYDAYRYGNWTKEDLDHGGAYRDVWYGKALTELSGVTPDENYLDKFDLSPAIGTDSLAFYEAHIGSKSWSPLSYFIPFSPLTLILAITSVVITERLQFRVRKQSTVGAILTVVSSILFLFGLTFLIFAYNAGYQGTMIASLPAMKIIYDAMLNAFVRGEKLWYFRTPGTILEFSDISHIPMSPEENVDKLISLMCESPGKVIAALYEVEYFELQLSAIPQGCRLQKVNLMEPSQPSSTFHLFKPAFYYFLLPKKLPRRLQKAINFVANSVFQADQRESIFLHSSVYTRSFPLVFQTPQPTSNAPFSFYSIGIILLIVISLQFVAIIVFFMEIAVHRLRLVERFENSRFRLERK